jgi:hypothetical protein
MSMGRLLAAGKSLIGAQDASSRYRLDKKARLPRFGSPKNPFAAGQQAPTAVHAVSPHQTAATAELQVSVTGPAPSPPPPPVTRLRRAARRLREWCVEANPIPRLAGPARSAFTVAPRFTSAPIQNELSLDAVKVVRNDLCEADLEIVPVKAVRRADLVPVPEENAWSRLTTRIFVRAKRD